MMMTLSPSSTCGVKVALCLPRRRLAMIVARRPTTRPSASIKIHFFTTSAGFWEKVAIEVFLRLIPDHAIRAFLVAYVGKSQLRDAQNAICSATRGSLHKHNSHVKQIILTAIGKDQ